MHALNLVRGENLHNLFVPHFRLEEEFQGFPVARRMKLPVPTTIDRVQSSQKPLIIHHIKIQAGIPPRHC
jgi:hypothetical protein